MCVKPLPRWTRGIAMMAHMPLLQLLCASPTCLLSFSLRNRPLYLLERHSVHNTIASALKLTDLSSILNCHLRQENAAWCGKSTTILSRSIHYFHQMHSNAHPKRTSDSMVFSLRFWSFLGFFRGLSFPSLNGSHLNGTFDLIIVSAQEDPKKMDFYIEALQICTIMHANTNFIWVSAYHLLFLNFEKRFRSLCALFLSEE